MVVSEVGDGEAEGAQDAAGAGDEDGLDAELFCEGAGVHPAGPAEGEEGELSGVEATLDTDHAQCPSHLCVRHPHHPERDLFGFEPELLAERSECLLRELAL